MFEHVFELIIFLFAAYGFAVFMLGLFGSLTGRGNGKGIRFCLLVKNSQDNIEGTVKTILGSGLPRKYSEDRGVTVIDMGSTDETPAILERLEKDLDNMYLQMRT